MLILRMSRKAENIDLSNKYGFILLFVCCLCRNFA